MGKQQNKRSVGSIYIDLNTASFMLILFLMFLMKNENERREIYREKIKDGNRQNIDLLCVLHSRR